MEPIPFAQLEGERMKMLKRLDGQQMDDHSLLRRASAELARRLASWSGEEGPPAARRYGAENALPLTVSADPIELPITRALSADRWRPSFGVTAEGLVYVTQDGNWLDSSRAVPVTGLSPLLDEVAAGFIGVVDPTGGRFFERNGDFAVYPDVHGNSPTFAVYKQPGLWRRLILTVHGWWNSDDLPDETLDVDFSDGPWPSSGVLSKMGYRVGNNGRPTAERREILKRVEALNLRVASLGAEGYIAEWGQPRSPERRSKIVRCLAGFAAGARRKTSADMSSAISDWEDDLKWFTDTFGPIA